MNIDYERDPIRCQDCQRVIAGPPAPWSEFLRARAVMIDDLALHGQNDSEIMRTLNLDSIQHVQLIRERQR